MAVSSLREITVGVKDLDARARQFESGCGLTVIAKGAVTAMAATRLFDTHLKIPVTMMGRPAVDGAPGLRLVQVTDVSSARSFGLDAPGPLGVGFTTQPIAAVQTRLLASGVRFVSSPQRLGGRGSIRFEAFGRTEDGDFIQLIERENAAAPYGTLATDCSEPVQVSFVVTNLEPSLHFMRDVLEHETLVEEGCAGSPFDALLGLKSDVSFRHAILHRPGWPTGRCAFMEFAKSPKPMAQTPSLAPGLCRLRYDTTDLHSTLSRLPGGGGSLVKGPASIDDPVLGRGLVAMVRAPFGMLIELWQTH